MRGGAIWLFVLAGLATGFAGTIALLTIAEQRPMPIDVTASLKGQTGWIATLGTGWGPIGLEGTPVSGPVATLELPLPHPAENDLVLEVRVGTNSATLDPPATIGISVNAQPIGTLILAKPLQKRLLLPADVASLQNPMRIDITTNAPARSVIVQEILIKEVTLLTDAAGHLDACSNGTIAGWAASGGGPAPVVILRSGIATMSFLPSLDRPDLPAAGQPRDAGFNVTLSPPPEPGERIDVRFGNGKPIRGVACH